LEGNLLDDPSDRSVLVYLPPSFDLRDHRYPVLYLLHGNGSHNTLWTEGLIQGMDIKASMDFSETLQPPENPEWWSTLLTFQDINQAAKVADWAMVKMVGLAAAFTPNPNRPPFYRFSV